MEKADAENSRIGRWEGQWMKVLEEEDEREVGWWTAVVVVRRVEAGMSFKARRHCALAARLYLQRTSGALRATVNGLVLCLVLCRLMTAGSNTNLWSK